MRRPAVSPPSPDLMFIRADLGIEVRCYGRRSGDWTLTENPGAYRRIAAILDNIDGGTALMPNPSRFNARIVHHHSGSEWHERRCGNRIRRGPFADGVAFVHPLGPLTFGITSADCPTVVLSAKERPIHMALHAGRDSLIDRSAVTGEGHPRAQESVIEAAMETFFTFGVRAADIRAFTFCGIAGNAFVHDRTDARYGEVNRKLLDHLRTRYPSTPQVITGDAKDGIDLHAIIASQLRSFGVPDNRIVFDGVDTYGDRDAAGEPIWASQRRDGKGRNLVLFTMR